MTHTRTYVTTNIVVFTTGGDVYAEDFTADSSKHVYPNRIAAFLDPAHFRYFRTVRDFSLWLWERGDVVVDECHILGETMSDEERQAGVLRPVP